MVQHTIFLVSCASVDINAGIMALPPHLYTSARKTRMRMSASTSRTSRASFLAPAAFSIAEPKLLTRSKQMRSQCVRRPRISLRADWYCLAA